MNRLKYLLSLSLCFSSACFSISFIAGSLLMVRYTGGNGNLGGLPAAVMLVAGSLAVFPAGNFKDRYGFKPILLAATICGAIGGGFALAAAAFHSAPLMLACFAAIGMAHGMIFFSRYAVAELVAPENRAKVMSFVLSGTAVGSIGGPMLIAASQKAGLRAGMDPDMLLFGLVSVLYASLAIAAWLLWTAPRPTPAAGTAGAGRPAAIGIREFLGIGKMKFVMFSMIMAQIIMVAIMAITPLHMHGHHHAMGAISLALSAHFIGMYGLSMLSAWFSGKFGREGAILAGSVLFLAAGACGAIFESVPGLVSTLFLLGLAWNFCFLGGSAMISVLAKGRNMGKMQGFNETLVNASSALASLTSGFLLGRIGMEGMLAAGCAGAVLIGVAYALTRNRRLEPAPLARAPEMAEKR